MQQEDLFAEALPGKRCVKIDQFGTLSKCDKQEDRKSAAADIKDPDLKGSNILHTIYSLAIKHRLDPSSTDDIGEFENGAGAGTKRKRYGNKTVCDNAEPSQLTCMELVVC